MAKLGETVASAVSQLQVTKTSDNVWKNYRLLLLAPANEGKTTAAATASEFAPLHLPAKEMTSLNDMLWILFDNDGLQGLRKLNMEVDYIDLSNASSAAIVGLFKQATNMAREALEAGAKKTIVIDSLSVMSCLIEGKVKKEYPGNKFGYWDAVLSTQTELFDHIKSLPGNVICTCHVTPVTVFGEPGSAELSRAQAKIRADGLKEGDLKLDIGGKVARFYRNTFSEIWPVKAHGKEPNREFKIHPYGVAGIEHKTKQSCFDKDEPANLRHMFQKIRG